jgi:hypothetical protein
MAKCLYGLLCPWGTTVVDRLIYLLSMNPNKALPETAYSDYEWDIVL